MKKRFSRKIAVSMLMCFLALFMLLSTTLHANSNIVSPEIQEHLLNELSRLRIPNTAIAIINGGDVQFISSDSNYDMLFQIGSVSKSFTGFGILLLEDMGLLSLNDPINMHLPWFEMYYQGAPMPHQDMTIANLLTQTDGVVISPPSEPTVDNLIAYTTGSELAFFPGQRFSYTGTNYIFLGLIIEAVSGRSYDDFMTQYVLHPLGLYNTFTNSDHAYATGLVAGGHRLGFLRARQHNVPVVPLMIPTGWIYSNITDMARWAQIHMGVVDVGEQLARVAQRTQQYIPTAGQPFEGLDEFYAAGWQVHFYGGRVQHNGLTEAYFSMVDMFPYRNEAVVMLTNMQYRPATVIRAVNDAIWEIVGGDLARTLPPNSNTVYDIIDTCFVIAGIITTALFLLLVVRFIKKIRNKQSIRFKITFKVMLLSLLPLSLLAVAVGMPMLIVAVSGMSLQMALLNMPASAFPATIATIAMAVYAFCFWISRMFVFE